MTTVNDANPEATVDEVSETEGQEIFDRACKRELGVSAAVFLRAHESGAFPSEWDAAAIQKVEFLLPFVR